MSSCSWRSRNRPKRKGKTTSLFRCGTSLQSLIPYLNVFKKKIMFSQRSPRLMLRLCLHGSPGFLFLLFIQTHLWCLCFVGYRWYRQVSSRLQWSSLCSRWPFIVSLHRNLRHKITDTTGNGGGENLPCSQRAVYFKFHKWRRLKGAFEEVFNIPP